MVSLELSESTVCFAADDWSDVNRFLLTKIEIKFGIKIFGGEDT